jgi:CBS domain-containing protein
MKALDVCRKPVITATGGTALIEVARLMRSNHVGSVVVIGNGNGGQRKPVGIVTDRDIVMEVVAMGLDASTMTAADIMTQSPAVSQAGDDALWALKTMRDRGVRRLPVVDDKGDLAGMLAFDDLMQHVGTTLGDIALVIGSERSVEAMRRA